MGLLLIAFLGFNDGSGAFIVFETFDVDVLF